MPEKNAAAEHKFQKQDSCHQDKQAPVEPAPSQIDPALLEMMLEPEEYLDLLVRHTSEEKS